jgi:hypothetical protein
VVLARGQPNHLLRRRSTAAGAPATSVHERGLRRVYSRVGGTV